MIKVGDGWVDIVEVASVLTFSIYSSLYTMSIHHRDYIDKKECTCESTVLPNESDGDGILTLAMRFHNEGFVLTIDILSLMTSLVLLIQYLRLHQRLFRAFDRMAGKGDTTAEEDGMSSTPYTLLSEEAENEVRYTEATMHLYLRKRSTPLEREINQALKYTKQVKIWFGVFLGAQAMLSWMGFAIVLFQHDLDMEISAMTCACSYLNVALYTVMIIKMAFFTLGLLLCWVRLYFYTDDGLKNKIQLLVGMAQRMSYQTRRMIVERYIKTTRNDDRSKDDESLDEEEKKKVDTIDTGLFFAEIHLVLPMRGRII
jgi:hypothetical protein